MITIREMFNNYIDNLLKGNEERKAYINYAPHNTILLSKTSDLKDAGWTEDGMIIEYNDGRIILIPTIYEVTIMDVEDTLNDFKEYMVTKKVNKPHYPKDYPINANNKGGF